ncbi:aldolase catalytic domain-containing protein [Caldithrix abyssi]|nr:aldolase catalytic domain-containing protein [Caldithrix abyssi]
MKILDCTLRDGGYYNHWDFDSELVHRYLKAVNLASVDIVELGFRSFPKNIFLGPYAYTTDEFITQLNLPKSLDYGVMINGKELINNSNSQKIDIEKLFQKKENSPISLVRIAINFNHTSKVEAIAKILKDMGYQIGINMMQAHGKEEKEYINIAKKISSWDVVDVLYFADSLGNMVPEDVENICKALKKGWQGQLGIHTHNNKGFALINSVAALSNGITWCDGTITGMGRGAGNVATESLILEMSRLGYHKGNANMLQPSIEDFTVLKNTYAWGPNLYYHYAANHGIHPTFVQSLLADKRYDNHQVLGALEFLAGIDSSAFNAEGVRKAIYGNHRNVTGTWDATNWLDGKEVLIVGAGFSVKQYKEGIMRYIEKRQPAVLFLNINPFLLAKIATATIVSNETRALFDAQHYSQLGHPIIMPKARIDNLLKDQLKGLKILDYGLTLEEDSFEINRKDCKLHWTLAAAYALSVATQARASKIGLVGFDGYAADDPRQEEMNEVFFKYASIKESLNITSLTPTTYRINQNSIFSPVID